MQWLTSNIIERHLFRHEWQHSLVDGDRLSLRLAGLPSADSSPGTVQRYL